MSGFLIKYYLKRKIMTILLVMQIFLLKND